MGRSSLCHLKCCGIYKTVHCAVADFKSNTDEERAEHTNERTSIFQSRLQDRARNVCVDEFLPHFRSFLAFVVAFPFRSFFFNFSSFCYRIDLFISFQSLRLNKIKKYVVLMFFRLFGSGNEKKSFP